ncbi:MAG: phosphoribosyltransferase [Gaiellaceae bacterium]
MILFEAPLFDDRRDAGRRLGVRLCAEPPYRRPLVLGLARGGVAVAAEVAAVMGAPLDVVAVRKVGHLLQPEYAIGAVVPGGGRYLRGPDGLTAEQVEVAVERAAGEAERLDARLHATHPPLDPAGATAIVVDDGLATGATMIAACRWARARGAERVVAAVPVVAADSLPLVRPEVDGLVALFERDPFFAVSLWYSSFPAVEDADVLRLLDEARGEDAAATPPTTAL